MVYDQRRSAYRIDNDMPLDGERGNVMASPSRKQYGIYSFWAGLVLAVLFAVLTFADESNRAGYIPAMIVCIVAAIAGLIISRTATT
jgi:hypothetical protein